VSRFQPFQESTMTHLTCGYTAATLYTMKIVILTDSTGKCVGASMVNGDERALKSIESLLGAGLADLRCQVIEADSLADLGRFVASEVKEAADEAAAES
jgi:hypothetical protein